MATLSPLIKRRILRLVPLTFLNPLIAGCRPIVITARMCGSELWLGQENLEKHSIEPDGESFCFCRNKPMLTFLCRGRRLTRHPGFGAGGVPQETENMARQGVGSGRTLVRWRAAFSNLRGRSHSPCGEVSDTRTDPLPLLGPVADLAKLVGRVSS